MFTNVETNSDRINTERIRLTIICVLLGGRHGPGIALLKVLLTLQTQGTGTDAILVRNRASLFFNRRVY
jgi:hypothetical protein